MNKYLKRRIIPLFFFLSIFIIAFFIFIANNNKDIVNNNFNGFKNGTDINMDEVINGTVTANLTRKIFPPMVRINPLIEKQGSWIEGPYWQHLPPLYLYTPLPFINLFNNGIPSPNIIRMSYITIMFFACIIFIMAVYFWEGTILSLLGATTTLILFISTKFTQQLMLGYVFNNSDIVLFFSIICSFFALGWYLYKEKKDRLNYSLLKISIISIIVTLPIVVKTLLGAMPLATFIFLIIKDRKSIFNKQIILAVLIPILLLIIFYLPFYFSSPDTFIKEIMLPINHISGNNELFRFPFWHYYFTKILPNNYLGYSTIPYYFGLILSIYFFYKTKLSRKTKNILFLSIIWFIWNITVVSISLVKNPNFIFQTYIFSLFFIVYSFLLFINEYIKNYKNIELFNKFKNSLILKIIFYFVFITAIVYSTKTIININKQIKQPQETIDQYDERFWNFSEIMKDKAVNSKDIIILYSTYFDEFAFKYYLIFNTGAESDSFERISNGDLSEFNLKKKYNNVYIVLKNSIIDTSTLKTPHETDNIGDFSLITIKSEDISESFKDDLVGFINTLPYKVNLKKNNYANL